MENGAPLTSAKSPTSCESTVLRYQRQSAFTRRARARRLPSSMNLARQKTCKTLLHLKQSFVTHLAGPIWESALPFGSETCWKRSPSLLCGATICPTLSASTAVKIFDESGSPEDMQNFASGEAKFCHPFGASSRNAPPARMSTEVGFGSRATSPRSLSPNSVGGEGETFLGMAGVLRNVG